jgi:hypothetical protein
VSLNPSLFPAGTHADIPANFAIVKRWDDVILLNCELCESCMDIGVWLDGNGVILPKHVRTLAAHLFTVHFINHLHGAARGT